MAAITRYGSRANLPTTGLTEGELLATLDRGTLYTASSPTQLVPLVPAVDELEALAGSGVDASNDLLMVHDSDAAGVRVKKVIVGQLLAAIGSAPLSSPAFTGVPSAPTAAPGTDSTQLATTAFVRAALAALLDSSPAALDSLNELAAALGDDPNFAATMVSALAGKEPTIAAGTATKYWRGDKTWRTLNKAAVGLSSVDNTPDADKPVSTAQQAALDLKADKAQEAWTAATLQNSWSNYGSGYQSARFFKDGMGVVHIEGLVGGGSPGAAVLTLPAGYRPPAHLIFPVSNANVYGEITVGSDGTVVVWGDSNNMWLSLSGIQFRAA